MGSKLLIFDLDGTLIDSRADLTAAINRMRADFGLEPLGLDTVGGFVGNGARKLVERSIAGTGLDAEKALEVYLDHYAEHMTDLTIPYPGVAEGLTTLSEAGFRMAVLSNKPGDASRAILSSFGFANHMEPILGGGDLPALKPAPDGVFACMEAAGSNADSTWMIGDHHTDLAVAENAGVKSGFAAYGFGEARGLVPTRSFASFRELTEFFANE